MSQLPDRRRKRRIYLLKRDAGSFALFLAVLCMALFAFSWFSFGDHDLVPISPDDFFFEDNNRCLIFSSWLAVGFSLTAWALFRWSRVEAPSIRRGKPVQPALERMEQRRERLRRKTISAIWTNSLVFMSILPVGLYLFRTATAWMHGLISRLYWFDQCVKYSTWFQGKERLEAREEIHQFLLYSIIASLITLAFACILYRCARIIRKGRAVMMRLSQRASFTDNDLRTDQGVQRLSERRRQRWEYLKRASKSYGRLGITSCIFVIFLWGAINYSWLTLTKDIPLSNRWADYDRQYPGKLTVSDQYRFYYPYHNYFCCESSGPRMPDNLFMKYVYIYIHPISALLCCLIAPFSLLRLKKQKRAVEQLEYYPPVVTADLPDEEILVRGSEMPAAKNKILLRATTATPEIQPEQLLRPDAPPMSLPSDTEQTYL